MSIDFRDFLGAVVERPLMHAKFLNTLSLLEYMGARKILKSQRAETISYEILAHTSEEIRHAQMLKKLSLKLSEGKLEDYSSENLLCGAEGARYFQTIDTAAFKALGHPDPWVNYLLTTLLIEERANSIYPHYAALPKAELASIFKGIVREEDTHLQDILVQIRKRQDISNDFLQKLRRIEDEAFSLFVGSLHESIQNIL